MMTVPQELWTSVCSVRTACVAWCRTSRRYSFKAAWITLHRPSDPFLHPLRQLERYHADLKKICTAVTLAKAEDVSVTPSNVLCQAELSDKMQ